jgi:hypothetical protein
MDVLNPMTYDADEDQLRERTKYSQMDRLLIPAEFQQQAVSTGVSFLSPSFHSSTSHVYCRRPSSLSNSMVVSSLVLTHGRHRGRLTKELEDITLRMLTDRSFVMNRFTDKLTPLTDRIFCLRSGSAADTQAIAQVVTYQLDFLSYVVAH